MKNILFNIITQEKLLLSNGVVFTLSLTNIEMILKIILLSTSIIWTGIKVYNELKSKKQKEQDERKD
tara:strand:+ start:988 stop:1188 length:201 start_codon:yes stop_codon:yes gene_type:complete